MKILTFSLILFSKLCFYDRGINGIEVNQQRARVNDGNRINVTASIKPKYFL